MAIRQWLLSCIPGLSILLLFLLVELSLGIGRSAYLYLRHKQPQAPLIDPVITQILFSVYGLALHVLAAIFPIRLARAARAATNAVRVCHSKDLLPLSEEERGTTMVIILPAYKETLSTLRETLDVLACHVDAPASYDVSSCSSACTILTETGLPRHGRTRSRCAICCKAADPRVYSPFP
jgi:hypothetical protein